MQDLGHTAAQLLETASKLQAGPERDGILKEIDGFRRRIEVMIEQRGLQSISLKSLAAA